MPLQPTSPTRIANAPSTLRALPSRGLRGRIALPGDKSISHRAALLAALSDGDCRVDGFLTAGVTQTMLGCLSRLGVEWGLDAARLHVRGVGLAGLKPPSGALDCGNSATTLRLLAGALAAAGIPAELDGSPGLRLRPMRRLLEPLTAMGAPITGTPQDTAPLRLGARRPGQRLRGGDFRLEAASAQVKSALLLAALAADSPVSIREPGPSRDHTERLFISLGLPITVFPEENCVALTPPVRSSLPPFSLAIPGDFSSAAFLIVAALIIPGSLLEIHGVGLNPRRTGLLDVLRAMGAEIRITAQRTQMGEPVGDLEASSSALKGVEVGGDIVPRMIDEFPILAVAAAFAEGVTRVQDAGELRHKETDRIHALASQFAPLGVDIREHADGFSIRGRSAILGGRAGALGDHRLALALAVMGLASQEGVEVRGGEILNESFPNFVELAAECGGEMVWAG